MRVNHGYAAAAGVLAVLAVLGIVRVTVLADVRSTTHRHFAANGNLNSTGDFLPARAGFTLADVSSRAELDVLPTGVQGLVYLGLCDGATPAYRAAVDGFARDPKLFGYYLIDEPDPAKCPASALAAESAYVHRTQPGVRTFILEQNLSSSKRPTFRGGYNPANTGIDLFGIDPYPCRSELGGCDWGMVSRYVDAAVSAGIPRSALVPVFQGFGGGAWVDDGGGRYLLPSADDTKHLLTVWNGLVPDPVFDFVYSWGVQRSDRSVAGSPDLQKVYAYYNHAG